MQNQQTVMPAGKPQLKSQVFLSFAAEDQELVMPLVEKLQAAGFSILQHTDDIHSSGDCYAHSEQQIIEADQVIIALSPHSAVAEHCRRELDIANRWQKRIAPVVIAELEGVAVPPAINRLSYTFLTPPANYERSVTALLDILLSDIDWVREHTRLGKLAQRWDQHRRSHKFTLRGKSLSQAEQWLTMPPDKTLAPAPLQRDFIHSSRQYETQRTRRIIKVLAGLLVIALVSGGFAWMQLMHS